MSVFDSTSYNRSGLYGKGDRTYDSNSASPLARVPFFKCDLNSDA